MTIARKDIVLYDGMYHCVSRCVRQSHLCGFSKITQKSYEHRREWVKQLIKKASEIFMIDVLSYAVMNNHYHILIKTKSEALKNLSDEEVAYRWWKLYPKRYTGIVKGIEPTEEELMQIIKITGKVSVWRERLGNIGWFMKSINEPLARLANKEDKCTGRFWEGRYKCQYIADEGALLKCSMYIELNPIRAKIADTPENSEYTSVYDRIKTREAKAKKEEIKAKKIALNEEEYVKLKKELKQDEWLAPLFNDNQQKGILSLDFKEYLELLEWTGRQLREDKRGAISDTLKPILERLRLKTDSWVESMTNFRKVFHRTIGNEASLITLAPKYSKNWLQGLSAARKNFC